MIVRKETEDAFNEFLRKYESGEIPKEEWETQPPAELHLFRRRRMVPVPPNLLQEFSESESSLSAMTATSKTGTVTSPPMPESTSPLCGGLIVTPSVTPATIKKQ